MSAGQAPAWASEWGDDRFGPFVILEIPKSDSGVVTQRWRWIPPGTFLMGSPKSEPGRSENEGPVHHVTLSTGFWMADTPCTQEFWEAVMRRNPSRFVDPQRPVERVTWSDLRDFVTQLNALVPGLNAELPTEAQWEYACRADSRQALYETPGATGEIEILGECNAPALDWIAWYTGNSGIDFELTEGADSRNWPRKQYPHKKAGTHPVGRKLPNGWGLYDMLGNVWEWCAD
ncbi:MAG: formylglycine-generating enzyme family protein, partial [Planctomycetota bacterium]|nr:formylglycine-generating enzyme family protein [Planctomycetota bacterium]